MRKLGWLGLALILTLAMTTVASSRAARERTFIGNISDSMCGLKHSMPGSAKECTEKCVSMGAKYVLADEVHKKVYQLSDQDKPKEFAGEKVKVVGALSGDTIDVKSITAVK